MKLLRSIKTETYQEIEVERTFLFWSWRTTYRKIENEIFEYKAPNSYYVLGTFEYYNLKPMFKIQL